MDQQSSDHSCTWWICEEWTEENVHHHHPHPATIYLADGDGKKKETVYEQTDANFGEHVPTLLDESYWAADLCKTHKHSNEVENSSVAFDQTLLFRLDLLPEGY